VNLNWIGREVISEVLEGFGGKALPAEIFQTSGGLMGEAALVDLILEKTFPTSTGDGLASSSSSLQLHDVMQDSGQMKSGIEVKITLGDCKPPSPRFHSKRQEP